MHPSNEYVETIYKIFEDERRRHPTYKEKKFNKVEQYKELIKFLLEKEEVDEAELILQAKKVGLGLMYYKAFRSILKNYLGFIDFIEEDGYRTIKITNELRNALNDDDTNSFSSSIDDFEYILMNYENHLITYLKDAIVKNIDQIKDNKIKISMKELYNLGFTELVEFTLLSMENYYRVKDWIEELLNEELERFGEDEDYTVILHDFPKVFDVNIDVNKISSKYVNKVVEFEGYVAYASQVTGIGKRYLYRCSKCGREKEIYFRDLFEKFRENEVVCKECGSKMEFKDIVEYADFQELIISGIPSSNGNAREQRVLYEDTNGIYDGYVRVTGIVRPMRRGKKKIYEYVVQAINIERLDDYMIKLTEEDIENIKKIAKRKDVIDILADRLIPEIKGHHIVKKAVFLQQIKGVKKLGKRENINILLITDPGVGKTVILKKIAKLPGNSYINLPTATLNSIIGIAEKKQSILGEGFVIKIGTIPRTVGTVCIDEFYAKGDEYKKILEVMESDTANIDKGGQKVITPIKCAFLAACNPKRGRFDRDRPVAEQIDIPAPLLSRFDLIFPLMDKPDKKSDDEIADYVIDVHRAYLDEEVNEKIKLDYIEVDGVRVDFEFISKYIYYARQFKPVISEKAKRCLKQYYLEMRKLGEANDVVPITARQLEGSIRIAEAVAKAKLKDVVDEEDAKEAIEIIDACLKEIAYDPEKGVIDIDKIAGTPSSRREKINKVFDIIKELCELSGDNLVPEEEIKEKAESIGLSEKDVEDALNYLKRAGDIYNPRYGFWGLLK